MAFIHQDPDVIAAFKGKAYGTQKQHAAALDYPQLVKLYRDSKTDASAAMEFDRLPPGEQRLAKQITKAYTPSKKLSKAEKALRKAAKRNPAVSFEQKVYAMWGDSPDPVIREAARKIAGK